MNLNVEYLPASGSAAQELVLLHGWGSNREVWRPLLAELRGWASVTLLDLPAVAPGCGDEAPSLESLLEAVRSATPDAAVYLGWSLGGQLALELATRYPDAVTALVTLCSTPRFTATGDWPGMPPAALSAFTDSCVQNPAAALRRFDSLQLAGVERSRALRRELQRFRAGEPGAALATGLCWLGALDQRAALAQLPVPQLHLLGDRDGLLAPALSGAMAGLVRGKPGARVSVLPGCGHPAPLEAPREIASRVKDFLAEQRLLRAPSPGAEAMSKRDVAESFSRAARQYDSVAQLQRDVGERLLAELRDVPACVGTVLDLGSGTGHFLPALRARFPGARYLGLDLAEGMVRFAREQHSGAQAWVVADAEALPLPANSVDLVFSSLAVQWCQRPELLFAELARVLRAGGRCVFTSLGPATLRELRAAWRAVDQYRHVNEFLPAGRLQDAAESLSGVKLALRVEPYRMQYAHVRELLNELKTLGAHNVNRGRPAGLTGRRALLGMLSAYEEWRDDDGLLPASYEVYFGTLEKQ